MFQILPVKGSDGTLPHVLSSMACFSNVALSTMLPLGNIMGQFIIFSVIGSRNSAGVSADDSEDEADEGCFDEEVVDADGVLICGILAGH